MTWNVWWRFGERWRDRHDAIQAVLDRTEPHVVGLQEVWGSTDGDASQAHRLAQRLEMHAVFVAPSLPAPPPDAMGEEVGIGLLSRWPITRTEVRRVPSVHRDAIAILAAEIAHPTGPLHAIVACTDYGASASASRVAQTSAMVELATHPSRDGDLPVLAMGDLNAPPETPEIRVASDRLTDGWWAVHADRDPGRTLRSSNPFAPADAWQIDRRIDYVFARPGRAGQGLMFTAAQTIDEPVNGIHPSDHAAVVMDLQLGD